MLSAVLYESKCCVHVRVVHVVHVVLVVVNNFIRDHYNIIKTISLELIII